MFIDELKNYIIANTDLVFGTDLFIGKLPIDLTSVVALQKSNTNNQYEFNNTLGYFEEEITIRIRGNQSELETRTLANTIYNLLENLVSVNFTNYRMVRGVFETVPYQLDGTDNNNNYIYVGVYIATLERK